MCLCFCFVWACGFCPSFLCATCSCQFVLTPPILLPVYWIIFHSCFPSLPSSFAPFIISLCLQFRVGSLPNVRCRLCPVLSCPVLSCPVLSCPVLSCPVLSCPALPCPALPCPALPCPALPCPALPSLVLPASLFFPYGVVFVCFIFVNKKPFNLLHLGPRPLPSPIPDNHSLHELYSIRANSACQNCCNS